MRIDGRSELITRMMIVLLVLMVSSFNHLLSYGFNNIHFDFQDTIKGGYTECLIYRYDFKNCIVDNSSKYLEHKGIYNSEGQLIEEIEYFDLKDTSNLVSWYYYDFNSGDSVKNKRTYEYDEKGRRTKIIYSSYSGSNDGITIILFDENDRICERISKDKYNDISHWVIYSFDSLGNIKESECKHSGERNEYLYDNNNRLIKDLFHGYSGTTTRKYIYDSVSYTRRIYTDRNGDWELEAKEKHDKNNNLIEYIKYEDNKKRFKHVMDYDDRNNNISYKDYDLRKGKELLDCFEICVFNEENKIIEYIEFRSDFYGKFSLYRISVKYDDHGNIIWKKHFGNEGPICVERYIYR